MRYRELFNYSADDSDSGDPQDNQRLENRRQEADEFYSAAHQAINRVLSGDSEAFLTSMEQTGGQ